MSRGQRLAKKATKKATADGSDAARETSATCRAYEVIAADRALIGLLSETPNAENNARVVERINSIWKDATTLPPHPQLASNLFSWAGSPDTQSSSSLPLCKLMKDRQIASAHYQVRKHRLVNLSNLNPNTTDKHEFFSQVPVRKCRHLAAAFPPPSLYVSETQDIYDRNMAFVTERNLPDWRIPRKFIFRLDDPSTWELSSGAPGLMHDLGPAESARFEDENGKLVAVVIRQACQDRRVVQFMDRSVKQTVSTRRNARKEDCGHISQMGLSAGSWSKPQLGWVRNIERQKHNTELHEKVNYDASSSFAVLWSLARSLLPDAIVDDFNAFMDTLGPDLRMDGNGTMGSDPQGKGSYHIVAGDYDFKFQGAELAPPCGVMAENYCRYTHFENQPHTWAVSLTTSRSFDSSISSLDAGGHFYISAYGIRIQAAAGTMVAWRPKDWHGTSLFHVNPDASSTCEEYHQRGLCIVTGNRIINAVKKWRAGSAEETELNEIEETVGADHPNVGEPGSNELDEFVAALQIAPLRRSKRLAKKPKKSFVGC